MPTDLHNVYIYSMMMLNGAVGLHTVDLVVIINNTTVIATLVYLTTCCNCNGHNLLGTTIAQVIIKKIVKNGDWTCNLSSNMVT